MDPVPPDEPVRLGQGDPAADLATWTADARIDAAAAERRREHWLRRQAGEEATLVGLLAELAASRVPAQLRTRADHAIRGPISVVGTDFVVIDSVGAGAVFVPLATLASVRATRDAPAGDAAAAQSVVMGLAETLVELAAERPVVIVVTPSERVRGELGGAGRDVVTVVPEGDAEPVHVAIDAIDHLVTVAR